MTKVQIIDDIRRFNRTAAPEFLSQFRENDLVSYLRRLLDLARERGSEELLRPVGLEEACG